MFPFAVFCLCVFDIPSLPGKSRPELNTAERHCVVIVLCFLLVSQAGVKLNEVTRFVTRKGEGSRVTNFEHVIAISAGRKVHLDITEVTWRMLSGLLL